MIVMKITNVVSKCTISGFEKDVILSGISNAEYRPNGFPAICTLMNNGITISLFDSGKIISMGAKSSEDSLESIIHYIKRIKKLGMNITVLSKAVVSLIVSHVSFGKKIDIESLKKTSQFKKEIKRFSSIQLGFDQNINVQAYSENLVISGKDVNEMMSVVKQLEKYTVKQ